MILEIISPQAKLYSGEVYSVTLPGVSGSFQILDNHAPIVSILKEGLVRISGINFNFPEETVDKFVKVSNKEYTLQIQSGTIEMKNNKIILLVK